MLLLITYKNVTLERRRKNVALNYFDYNLCSHNNQMSEASCMKSYDS
jgi:hypothetical protein